MYTSLKLGRFVTYGFFYIPLTRSILQRFWLNKLNLYLGLILGVEHSNNCKLDPFRVCVFIYNVLAFKKE